MKIIRIGIGADTGYINSFQENNIKLLEKMDIDYYFLLGDNFYPSGLLTPTDDQFQRSFVNRFPKKPCFAVLGNHDYLQNPSSQIQICKDNLYPFWKMPHFFYDVVLKINQESIHFIFIDTCLFAKDITMKLLTTDMNKYTYSNLYDSNYHIQLLWLHKILNTSQSRWKIICGHYPIYSNGPHQCSAQLRSLLLPIFQRYKIDCYISGHDHNLQHIEKDGIHYFITGSFSDLYKSPIDHYQYLPSFFLDNYGFLLLEIVSDFILQFSFVDIKGNFHHPIILQKNL